MTTIIVIAFFILLMSHLQLRERVSNLENKNTFSKPKSENIQTSLTPIPRPEFSSVAIPPLPKRVDDFAFAPVAVSHDDALEKSTKPAAEFILFTWFKEHTLIKIGGLIFFLGAVWFVSYAIDQGWLSPELRILLGFALALAIYVLAWYRAEVETIQYVVLTAVGTGIICATVSAAQIIFSMFSPVFALFILAGSIAYTVFVAFLTGVTWLTFLSGLTGLLVPVLISSTSEPLWLLFYLLVLASGLIFVSLKMGARYVTLLMVCGVTNFEIVLLTQGEIADKTLWFFVVIFSALFFASITKSLIASSKPSILDITTFGIVGLVFVLFASDIALNAGLATFIATFVIGFTGYLLAQRNFPLRVVSVFIAAAGAGVLIGTSFIFSEFALVLAYAIEITFAFLVATYLGLPSRVIWIVAATYVLPVIGSSPSFTSIDWQTGIFHPDALVVYTVTLSLFTSMLWVLHHPTVLVYRWSKALAVIFGTTGFFYTYAVIALVTDSLFNGSEALVSMYILWAVLSLVYVYYAIRQKFSTPIITYCSFSLFLPITASLSSFSSPAWSNGVSHPDGLGVLGLLLVLFLTTLIVTQHFCKDYDASLRKLLGVLLVTTVSYLFVFFYVFWHGILTPVSLAQIAIYSSYAWVLYGLTSIFVLLRANVRWIGISISSLALPVIMSLDSFNFSGWSQGTFPPEAVGLFGLVLVFLLLALGLRKHYSSEKSEDEKTICDWSRLLFGLAFVYSVGLVWCTAHTFVAKEQAISIALFVYTISGLFFYQYGKISAKLDFKYLGIALLSVVVVRLLVIDVWNLDPIWRVITFLGVGTLFIGTALLEKKK